MAEASKGVVAIICPKCGCSSKANITLAHMESLADIEHKRWSGWMEYLFSKCTTNKDRTVTIPEWAVDRWVKQCETEYIYLSENEKESDRREVRNTLEAIKPFHICGICGEKTELDYRVV